MSLRAIAYQLRGLIKLLNVDKYSQTLQLIAKSLKNFVKQYKYKHFIALKPLYALCAYFF